MSVWVLRGLSSLSDSSKLPFTSGGGGDETWRISILEACISNKKAEEDKRQLCRLRQTGALEVFVDCDVLNVPCGVEVLCKQNVPQLSGRVWF